MKKQMALVRRTVANIYGPKEVVVKPLWVIGEQVMELMGWDKHDMRRHRIHGPEGCWKY